ncbi:MAG: DUF1707 domain-containing protein, partial [Stackebrandtia sp.]
MDKSANKGRRPRRRERAAARALLDAARDDGRLTETEHATRTARVARVRTISDLRALTGPLRTPVGPHPAAEPVRGMRPAEPVSHVQPPRPAQLFETVETTPPAAAVGVPEAERTGRRRSMT